VEALFRPVSRDGFWAEDGRIVRALLCSHDEAGKLVWREDTRLLHRYHGFAFMGLGDWRASRHGSDRFDAQIESAMAWYDRYLGSSEVHTLPSYGLGACLYGYVTLASRFPHERSVEAMINEATARIQFDHHEDALVIMGLSRSWERLTHSRRRLLADAVNRFLTMQTPCGLFVFPRHPTSFYHQNQMYICWGLGQYGLHERSEEMRNAVRRNLEFTVRRRMLPDGGLVWHEGGRFVHRLANAYRKVVRRQVIDVQKLYECHQTFFANAADCLARLGDPAFGAEAELALNWIFGGNVRRQNLVELTGIGVPWRAITRDGEIWIMQDLFKGVYEIGSFLRALSADEREGT